MSRHEYQCLVCKPFPKLCYHSAAFAVGGIQAFTACPGGEIGRHRRLKISRPNGRTGSIPVLGTIISPHCCITSAAMNGLAVCSMANPLVHINRAVNSVVGEGNDNAEQLRRDGGR